MVEFPLITSQEELIPVPEKAPVVSIKVLETEGSYGRFAVEPLERGLRARYPDEPHLSQFRRRQRDRDRRSG